MGVSGYGLADWGATVNLNLAKTHDRLLRDVTRLSSGLRINSAVDDPSGLAIAEGLRARVNGYDQATSNTQTALNAMTVADGALAAVTDLLQRLRSLSVAANNDLLSDTDRGNIQTECTQLQTEISAISENTTFNGVQLFSNCPRPIPSVSDGMFTQPATATIVTAPLGTPWTFSAAIPSGNAGIANSAFLQANSQIPQTPPSGSTQIAYIYGNSQNLVSQSVSNFAAGVPYSVSFNMIQSMSNANLGNNQQVVELYVDNSMVGSYSPIPANPLNPPWTSITTPPITLSGGAHTLTLRGQASSSTAFIDDVQIAAVAGATQTAALLADSPTLGVHDGADEGDLVALPLANVDTQSLGISANSVLSSGNAATAETNVDLALDYITTLRADLGSRSDTLQYQATNNASASAFLTSSESSIRDLNIAQTASELAQDQIVSVIGQSILGNATSLAASVEMLFR